MAKQRYMLVRGKPGVLVSNPWALAARRYAGKARDAALDGEPDHVERHRDCNEVLLSHVDLTKACTDGDLELLGQCVAGSADEAADLLKKGDK